MATEISAAAEQDLVVDARAWRIVESESGPTNYYSIVNEAGQAFVRAHYVPPMKTALLGWQPPERDRAKVKMVRWSWRARIVPKGADECTPGKGDSAAVVYLTWKRGLRYYTLKYVWSAGNVSLGRVCGRKRNPFVAQDTIIKQAGMKQPTAPNGGWETVEIDLGSAFRKHFEDGDPKADVPKFFGVGIMSDGDQTKSESSADFGTFTFIR
jgi:hypothetical protein